jgi:hypothetical protein
MDDAALQKLSADLDHAASLEEVLRELEWRKCFPDWEKSTVDEKVEAFRYFCEKYIKIRFPGKGRIPFILFEAQKEAVHGWLSAQQSIALKARQIGFSTVVAIFSLWCVFGWGDRTILMISKEQESATKLLRHARMAYVGIPEWMKYRGPMRIDNNTKKLSFSNDSWIDSLPSASDPARGETAWITIVDEIGKLPNSEEAWASLEPTADVGGKMIFLGTANGIDNLLFKLWDGAKNKMNGFKTLFFSWRSAHGRDDAWYAQKKFEYQGQEHLLHQEYPSDADEAFIKSGRMVFNLEHLEKQVVEEPHTVGYLMADGRNGPFQFEAAEDGPLSIWDFPRPGRSYVIGVDVAEGLEHGDFSSVHIIDARGPNVEHHRRVVATWHGHIDPDLLGSDVVAGLGWWYNHALVAVEINNGGSVVTKALQRVKYKHLYKQRRLTATVEKDIDQVGWRTTKSSKFHIIGALNGDLREGLDVRDALTLRELMTFVRDEHGRMSGSPHDDRVMSLAIAAHMLNYAYDPEFVTELKPGPGTMGWHMARAYAKGPTPVRTPIGASAVRR